MGTMGDKVGGTKLLPEIGPEFRIPDNGTVFPATEIDAARLHRVVINMFQDTPAPQQPVGIRWDLDACTDLWQSFSATFPGFQ